MTMRDGLSGKGPESARTAEQWFKKGTGETESVRKILYYTRAVTVDPDFAVAYVNRGVVYYRLTIYRDTVADCTKSLELDPKLMVAYYNRGVAYYYLEKYDKAVRDLTKAIELYPNGIIDYYYRENMYRYLGKDNMIVSQYDALIELSLIDSKACNDRENVQTALSQYWARMSCAEAYGIRGRAYNCLGERDKAIDDLCKVEEVADQKDRRISYRHLREIDKAIDDYNKAKESSKK